jgi:endonuclease YncB( thermonuclease family)
MDVMPTLSVKTVFVVVLLCFCSLTRADITGRVVAVTDGDTIKVLGASNTMHKVRLTGIDAPERGQPYGTASRDHLVSMVAGKEVKVESSKKDRYGRALGKVWV